MNGNNNAHDKLRANRRGEKNSLPQASEQTEVTPQTVTRIVSRNGSDGHNERNQQRQRQVSGEHVRRKTSLPPAANRQRLRRKWATSNRRLLLVEHFLTCLFGFSITSLTLCRKRSHPDFARTCGADYNARTCGADYNDSKLRVWRALGLRRTAAMVRVA